MNMQKIKRLTDGIQELETDISGLEMMRNIILQSKEDSEFESVCVTISEDYDYDERYELVVDNDTLLSLVESSIEKLSAKKRSKRIELANEVMAD